MDHDSNSSGHTKSKDLTLILLRENHFQERAATLMFNK